MYILTNLRKVKMIFSLLFREDAKLQLSIRDIQGVAKYQCQAKRFGKCRLLLHRYQIENVNYSPLSYEYLFTFLIFLNSDCFDPLIEFPNFAYTCHL